MIPIRLDINDMVATAPCVGCRDGKLFELQFEYAYQPIVEVSTKSIFAYEALVRGPEGQSAASVLDEVNESNRYQFDQACRVKAVAGAANLGMQERLSINFLPNAVYRPEVCIRTTFAAAKTYGFACENIIFEVTEGEKVQDRAHLVNIFRAYREFGFLTAIDDFGAGYAGLNLLAEYQPDIVKIDMELIRDIDVARAKQVIVMGIATMCRDMGIKVLAEGIETRGERDFLLSAGIDLMQGYWFSKPVFQGLATLPEEVWL